MEESDPAIQVDAENYLASGGLPFGNCAILGANGMLSSYLLNFISAVNAIKSMARIERRELMKTAASKIIGIISRSKLPRSNRSQGPGEVTSKNATTA